MFWEGVADGPSKMINLEDGKKIKGFYNYKQPYVYVFRWESLINNSSSFIGSVEERQFCAGQKNGTAVIRFVNGDTFEFSYSDGEMEGE